MPRTEEPGEPGASVPIVIYAFDESLSAVEVAYRLYHDPKRADELVKLNNVRHPLFMPKTIKARAW